MFYYIFSKLRLSISRYLLQCTVFNPLYLSMSTTRTAYMILSWKIAATCDLLADLAQSMPYDYITTSPNLPADCHEWQHINEDKQVLLCKSAAPVLV